MEEMITIWNRFSRNDWVQLKEELKDAIHHADSRVYMYTWLYLEWVCQNLLEGGCIGLKAILLADDCISHTVINKEALAK